MKKQRSARLLASAVGALLLVASALGCSWHDDPACTGRALEGAVSLWTACDVNTISAGTVPFTLTNKSAETIWFFHECGDEVPWPVVLEDDGTWTRLLPANTYLTLICHHVMELAPGESMELPMSTQHVERPGSYRAEMMVGRGCVDAHEPLHLPHSCASLDFLESESLELR